MLQIELYKNVNQLNFITKIIDVISKDIANSSFKDGLSLKKKIEINNAIINSICPKALTGATALAEKA